jgi:uncharacterized protein YndB with AHSA1/START domain
MTQACMGGHCRLRDSCPHYLAAVRWNPAERLCDKGADGQSSVHVIALETETPARVVNGWLPPAPPGCEWHRPAPNWIDLRKVATT